MDRRYLLTVLAAFAAGPAAAHDGLPVANQAEVTPLVDQIVAELKSHGYHEFRISRTFLGRTRIVAESKDRIRELLEQRFGEWGLTPAERDVALFSIKGLSTGEIAALRATSEGTVKAQSNAIYRKAGVSGRPQLLSLFLEELMDDETAPGRSAA